MSSSARSAARMSPLWMNAWKRASSASPRIIDFEYASMPSISAATSSTSSIESGPERACSRLRRASTRSTGSLPWRARATARAPSSRRVADATGQAERRREGEQELAVAARAGVGAEALRLERPLVELGGLLVGERPHRGLGGLAGVALHPGRLGLRQGAVRVVRELVDAEAAARPLLEGARDAAVELDAPRSGEILVERCADGLVDEAVRAGPAAGRDEARLRRVVETQEERLSVEAQRALEQRRVGIPPGDARDLEGPAPLPR